MTRQPLVLIVDDSEQNRKLARDVLRASGLETVEAATGADAITLAAERLPDVVLLDLRLPDMGGAEVARALRSNPRTAETPVIAVSALQPDDDWLREAGFAGSVEKPIDIKAFPEQVRRLARGDASTP